MCLCRQTGLRLDQTHPGSKVYLIATKFPIFTISALVKGGVITESGLLKFFFCIVMQISKIRLTVMGIKRIVLGFFG